MVLCKEYIIFDLVGNTLTSRGCYATDIDINNNAHASILCNTYINHDRLQAVSIKWIINLV